MQLRDLPDDVLCLALEASKSNGNPAALVAANRILETPPAPQPAEQQPRPLTYGSVSILRRQYEAPAPGAPRAAEAPVTLAPTAPVEGESVATATPEGSQPEPTNPLEAQEQGTTAQAAEPLAVDVESSDASSDDNMDTEERNAPANAEMQIEADTNPADAAMQVEATSSPTDVVMEAEDDGPEEPAAVTAAEARATP
ncbi:hypothetical protein H4R18_003661, partial [Coemansia javaensis]